MQCSLGRCAVEQPFQLSPARLHRFVCGGPNDWWIVTRHWEPSRCEVATELNATVSFRRFSRDWQSHRKAKKQTSWQMYWFKHRLWILALGHCWKNSKLCVKYWNTERVRFFVCSVYLQQQKMSIIISENTLNCFIGHSASLACKDEQIFIWSNSLLIFQPAQAKLDNFLRWLLWGVECGMLWTKATFCTCTLLASNDVCLFIQRAPLPMVFVVLCHLLCLRGLTSVQTFLSWKNVTFAFPATFADTQAFPLYQRAQTKCKCCFCLFDSS